VGDERTNGKHALTPSISVNKFAILDILHLNIETLIVTLNRIIAIPSQNFQNLNNCYSFPIPQNPKRQNFSCAFTVYSYTKQNLWKIA